MVLVARHDHPLLGKHPFAKHLEKHNCGSCFFRPIMHFLPGGRQITLTIRAYQSVRDQSPLKSPLLRTRPPRAPIAEACTVPLTP